MKKYLRLSLRTALILMLAFSVFCAWRLHDPESRSVAAILDSGGKTYTGFQEPKLVSNISVTVFPSAEFEQFPYFEIALGGPEAPPALTVSEFFFGRSDLRRIKAAELELDQCTSEVIDHLESLHHLELLLIKMPGTKVRLDSDEAKKLNEIREIFGQRVCPTIWFAK